MFHPRNNSHDKAMNRAETAPLHSGECFRNGHFAPKTGETDPLHGSLGQQLLDGGKCAQLALGPIALNDQKALMVVFQPVLRGLVKRQTFVQIRLAALTVIGPSSNCSPTEKSS